MKFVKDGGSVTSISSVQTTGGMEHACFRVFFFQAEDGIRDLVRSRGLGDVYKRQMCQQQAFAFRQRKFAEDHLAAPR